jgi:hypothetical protein
VFNIAEDAFVSIKVIITGREAANLVNENLKWEHIRLIGRLPV